MSVLLAGIGVLLLAVAIEGSRLVARIERWRVFVGEPSRPLAHPYRPLRGGVLDILRAEFADESRWRDVLYVAVNVPLTVIEFAVIVLVWAAALVTLTMPAWYEAAGWVAPRRLARFDRRDSSCSRSRRRCRSW